MSSCSFTDHRSSPYCLSDVCAGRKFVLFNSALSVFFCAIYLFSESTQIFVVELSQNCRSNRMFLCKLGNLCRCCDFKKNNKSRLLVILLFVIR
jgi:hypothetical protein